MANIEDIIYYNKIDLKEKFKKEYYLYKKILVKKLFLRKLDKKLQLEISTDCIQKYNDLTWDYYIGFSNKGITISDLHPLYKKQITILEKWINEEINILKLKLKNLDEYIKLKKKKERYFSKIKTKYDFKVINSLGEDITNKQVNKDRIEFIIKYLINFLTNKEEYNLKTLSYYNSHKEKIWKFSFHNKGKKLIISDYFIEEAEILEYNKIIIRDLFDIEQYYNNKQKYENNFYKHYLKKGTFINLVSPVITTLSNLKQELKNEKKLKEPCKERIIEIEKDINSIKNIWQNYIIRKNNILNCILKNNFNFKDLENLLIDTVILKYNLSNKEKSILKKLNVKINILFSNYKENF